MDGLLLHDGFETYYAGKKKPGEDKSRDDAPKKQLKPEALMARPAKWPPASREIGGEATNP